MPETTSLKALANKVLQRNNARNAHETRAHFIETKLQRNERKSEAKQAIDLLPYIDYYNEGVSTYKLDASDNVKSRLEVEWLTMNDTLAKFIEDTKIPLQSENAADFLKELYEATGFSLRVH